jgi:hypothetical protein
LFMPLVRIKTQFYDISLLYHISSPTGGPQSIFSDS